MTKNKSIQSTDPIQAVAIRAAIIGLMTLTIWAGLVLIYRGMFDLLSLSYSTAASGLMCGMSLGVGSLLLFRFRDDLMG